MSAALIDTGPPGAAGGVRPSGKGRSAGCKIASYRGERLGRSYASRGRESSQEAVLYGS
jgi:hypothetical protein